MEVIILWVLAYRSGLVWFQYALSCRSSLILVTTMVSLSFFLGVTISISLILLSTKFLFYLNMLKLLVSLTLRVTLRAWVAKRITSIKILQDNPISNYRQSKAIVYHAIVLALLTKLLPDQSFERSFEDTQGCNLLSLSNFTKSIDICLYSLGLPFE